MTVKEQVMDRIPPPSDKKENLFSCWGRLKLKLPWIRELGRQATTRQRSVGNQGSYRYDRVSYEKNFDDGSWDKMNEDSSQRSFSARYAAPSFKSYGDK